MKGGSLEFDIIANNDGINKALKETEKRIAGFSKTTVDSGKSIDAMFDATNENIRVQKQVIKELESEYAKLEKEIKKVGPGRGQTELISQARQIKAEIDAEKQSLTQLEAAVMKNEAAHVRLRTQVRNVVEQLAAMEQAGQRGTDEYKKLQAEAGRLTDAMGDAQAQAKILAHDNAGLQGVISAVSGVAGAFSAAQGVVGLFAGENENLQKIMVKVQSLMAITIGLQQVANTLNKDSYFRLVTLTKAKNLFTAATTRSSAALVKFGLSAGAANIAAKALVGTLTLGLSVAIGVAVAAINRINAKREEAQRKLKEQVQAESDARAEMIKTRFELETTMRSIKNFTGTKDEEKQKVEELNRKYGDSFGTYKTLTDWYDTLYKKAEDYIQILFLQAKAQSLVSKAVEADFKAQEVKATNADDVEGSMWWFAKMGLYQAQSDSYGKFDAQAAINKHNKEAKEKAVKSAEDIREGYLKEAEKLQEEIQKLTTKLNVGKVTATTTETKNSKDPFTELIANKKKQFSEYAKWVSSSDEGIRKAAKVEFEALIKEGETYEQYLRNLKDRLAKLPTSDTRNEQLRTITNELVNLEKGTYIDAYKNSLEEQLTLAGGLLEKLSLIAEQRKELDKPGTELQQEKNEVLDKEQKGLAEQAAEEARRAKQELSNYYEEKLDYEVRYWEQRKALELRIEQETNEERKQIYKSALEALNSQRELQDNTDYDGLLESYKSYQQKTADITAYYDKNIAIAKEKNNTELIAKLEQERNKALSSVALSELQDSGAWEALLGNLDDLTTTQLQALIAKIEGQRAQLGVELDPADLEVILNRLKAAKDEIQERNPFKALSSALKAYKEDASKANLGDIFTSVAGSIDLVKGSFDSVVGGLKNMGLAGDEVTQDLLGDIGDMLGAASELASGIATGNPLAIISGSVGLISSAFEVFNIKDRKAERAIKKHAEAVKELESAYKALEHAVDKALGESVYDNQRALIENMRQQQAHLQEMARQEENKKKTDHDKVKEYQEQYAELGRQIEDMIADIAQSITQTSAKDLASQLADTIADTFADGFDSNKVGGAIEKVVQQTMQNAVKNALKKQYLETYLQPVIDDLQKAMGFDSQGNGSFDGLTDAEQKQIQDRIAQIAGNYAEAMKMYEDLFKGFEDDSDPSTSLSGVIKGANQESIDLLAGQTNAVRVNQIVSIDLLREQLVALTGIYDRIGISNKLLGTIADNTASNNADPLRASGITL